MISRDPYRRPMFGGLGFDRPPRDLILLLAVVFVTFTLQFFESTAALPRLLRLTPEVWQQGFVWQLASYGFVGTGAPEWFLLELLILYWFGQTVYAQLGRRNFWRLLVRGVVGAGVVAVATQLALAALGAEPPGVPFVLMQGQRMLITILIAVFATVNRHATIYLFFVLPIRARWFLGLVILIAFMGFLGTRDLAGFLGISAAVAVSYFSLVPSGLKRLLRDLRLRLDRLRFSLQLKWLSRKRGLRLIKKDREDDGKVKRGPWVH